MTMTFFVIFLIAVAEVSSSCIGVRNTSKSFNVTNAAQELHNALTNRIDSWKISTILGCHNYGQRVMIAQTYRQLFGAPLMTHLWHSPYGPWQLATTLSLYPHEIICSQSLYRAVVGSGTEEQSIVQILAPLTNAEIKKVAAAYEHANGKSLEDSLRDDTSGDFEDLLVSILAANRSEVSTIDEAAAKKDARRLFEAGMDMAGTDESVFFSILTTRSYPQLRLIFNEYEHEYKHSLEYAIEDEFAVWTEACLLALVKCARNKTEYFVDILHNAAANRDKFSLFQIILSRAEIDLGRIKQSYQARYQNSIANHIHNQFRGAFGALLLGWLGE